MSNEDADARRARGEGDQIETADKGVEAEPANIWAQAREQTQRAIQDLGLFDRTDEAWSVVKYAGFAERTEPELVPLFRLADAGRDAENNANKYLKKARRLKWRSTLLTIAAAALAAVAGFGNLSTLVGATASAWLALASAVTGTVSAILQASKEIQDLTTKGNAWKEHSADIVDELSEIVANPEQSVEQLRDRAVVSLRLAREQEPQISGSRAAAGVKCLASV